MNNFEFLEAGILRLCVPFDNIYTSVFLLTSDSGTILLDSATTDEDVEKYILPALNSVNMKPDIIITSHLHEDHCGGMEALLKAFPKATAGLMDENKNYSNKTIHFKDGEVLFDRFQVLSLKGHTMDCLGILDIKTKTLLSCDSLQQYGIDKYKTYLEDKAEYIYTLNRLKQMDIEKIICSHDYEPCGCVMAGKESISYLYNMCEKSIK